MDKEPSRGLLREFVVINKPFDNFLIVPGFLEGKAGKLVKEEVERRKRDFYENHSFFGGLSLSSSKQVGFQSLYSAIEIENVLRENNLRTMEFQDIGELQKRKFNFNGGYYDLGIVYRGTDETKPNISRVLESQLLDLGFNLKLNSFARYKGIDKVYFSEAPIYFSLNDLENDFVEGKQNNFLRIKLSENAKPKYMPSLRNELGGYQIHSFDENGPIFENGPFRIQYSTKESGISRIVLRGLSKLDAANFGFRNASPNGRTIIMNS